MKPLFLSLLLIFLVPNIGIAKKTRNLQVEPQTERTIAVILGPANPMVINTVTMTVTDAEKLLATTKDPILRHALVIALGSLGTGDPEHDLAVHDRERFRFHRRPLQRSREN